jgi:colicin import membrane protein
VNGLRSNILPTLVAVAFHGVLIFLTSTTWMDQSNDKTLPRIQYIKAELIDLKAYQPAKVKQQPKAIDTEQKQAQRAKAKKLAAEKKRKAEKKKKQSADKKRKTAEKAKQEKAKQEKAKKLALDKKRKADAKTKAESKRLAEQKTKAENERRQAEENRLTEQKQQQEATQRAAREQQLRAQQMAEQRVKDAQLIASAESIIREAVTANWRRSPSARNGMQVVLRIHLFPTGEVDNVYPIKPSGDDTFDRDAANAVLKAERFPELQKIDPVLFDRELRTIRMTFRPEDLRL